MRTGRLVLFFVAALLVATATSVRAQVGSGDRIEITATEWSFTPNIVMLEEGKPVTLVFINAGRFPHNLTSVYLNNQTIRVTGQFTEGVFRPDNWRLVQAPVGGRYELTFTPTGRPNTGQVAWICSVFNAGHAALGMTGAFIIKPAGR